MHRADAHTAGDTATPEKVSGPADFLPICLSSLTCHIPHQQSDLQPRTAPSDPAHVTAATLSSSHPSRLCSPPRACTRPTQTGRLVRASACRPTASQRWVPSLLMRWQPSWSKGALTMPCSSLAVPASCCWNVQTLAWCSWRGECGGTIRVVYESTDAVPAQRLKFQPFMAQIPAVPQRRRATRFVFHTENMVTYSEPQAMMKSRP